MGPTKEQYEDLFTYQKERENVQIRDTTPKRTKAE